MPDQSHSAVPPPRRRVRASAPTESSRIRKRRSRDRAAQDQGVDVVRAFIGVDRLEVGGVAHDVEFGADAVAAVHVAGDAGDIERLAAIVALDQADRLGDQLALVEPPADAQRRLQAERDLGRPCWRASAGPAGSRRAAGRTACGRACSWRAACEAGLGRAHRAPGDAVAGAVEAAERAREAARHWAAARPRRPRPRPSRSRR